MAWCEAKALWQACFDDPPYYIDLFFSTAYDPGHQQCLYREGRLAAALYWMDCTLSGERLAYLYAVATHPDFRGQGLCRELMTRTHTLLRQQGYAGAMLVPGSMALRSMYGKMGYETVTRLDTFSCTAGMPVPIRPVTGEEYAQLRRSLLPPGGVVQEGAQLNLLERCAKLYAGENFLLAADAAEHFHGMEFLGDRAAAQGILAALGYSEGTFRTPGASQPFAMFRPLNKAAAKPAYFGLAFD